MQWVIGDTTNLIGAILTDQLFTQVSQSTVHCTLTIKFIQIATAVYFVLIDCVSVSQYIYYIIKNQGLKGVVYSVVCSSHAIVTMHTME